MSWQRKVILVLVLFVFVPIITAILNASLSTPTNFAWGSDNNNAISATALVVAILALMVIFFVSKQVIWKVVSCLLIVVLGTWLYFGLMFSPGF